MSEAIRTGARESGLATRVRFVRFRWWWARTFKTRDYRYVEGSEAINDD